LVLIVVFVVGCAAVQKWMFFWYFQTTMSVMNT
jgi:hypothetical protein